MALEALPLACCAPLVAEDLSSDEVVAAAALFKALADPTRVRIFNLLVNSPEAVCVCELNEAFDLSQPTLSHHLKKLSTAGLVSREQRGTWAYFSVVPDALDKLAMLVDPNRKVTA